MSHSVVSRPRLRVDRRRVFRRLHLECLEGRLPPGEVIGLPLAPWGLSLVGFGGDPLALEIAVATGVSTGHKRDERAQTRPEDSGPFVLGLTEPVEQERPVKKDRAASGPGQPNSQQSPVLDNTAFDRLRADGLDDPWSLLGSGHSALRQRLGDNRDAGDSSAPGGAKVGLTAAPGSRPEVPTRPAEILFAGPLSLQATVSLQASDLLPPSAGPGPDQDPFPHDTCVLHYSGAAPNGPPRMAYWVCDSPQPTPPSKCAGGVVKEADGAMPDNPDCLSDGPVRYFDGTVKLEFDDLMSAGFGSRGWGHTRSWTNAKGYAERINNGSGMVVSQLPYMLSYDTSSSSAIVILNGTNALFFDNIYTIPTARFSVQDKLVHTGGEFILTDTSGDQIHFYDFDYFNTGPDRWGKFKGMTDPYGNITTVTSWGPGGWPAEVQRSTPASQTPRITESYLYSYVASGVNQGLLANVTLRRQTGAGGWSTVRQVDYAYYDGTQPYGNSGDLQTATIKDAAATLDTKYYRYYPRQDSNFDGLKYVFDPQSYARLKAAVGDPFSATDDQVAVYATNYFVYDKQRRVTQEMVQGMGCSCANGQGTFTFNISTNPNPASSDLYNSWKYKTVETLPDNTDSHVSQNIVYSNAYGDILLKVYEGGVPGSTQQWKTFYKYDGQGRVILQADPSAVSGYDEKAPDLLASDAGGHYQYLYDNQGKIKLTDYYTATTATETTPGGVTGYYQDTQFQQGQLGKPVLQESKQYLAHSVSTMPVHVTVTTPGGISAATPADQFTYGLPGPPPGGPPIVTGLGPTSGSTAGADNITVIGRGFRGATRVSFGGTSATFFSVTSDNAISARVPAQAAGTVDVTITTPEGTSAVSLADRFTYVVPPVPAVTGLSITSGSAGGSGQIFALTILGTGFNGATAVSFSGTPATSFSATSDYAIQARVPAHAAGTVDVTVTNGTATSAITAADRFTYVVPPVPVVTGVGPVSGSTAGSTDFVTLIGSNFTGATAVSFGGTAATFFTVDSDNAIRARPPAHTAGTVDVVITTPGGASAATPADRFTYVAPAAPMVTGLSPRSGSTAGGASVTLIGSHFTGATAVSFGGTLASFSVSSDNAISVTAPAQAAGPVDVTVTTAGGTSARTAADQFTYVASPPPPPNSPTVTGLGPASGSTGGGYYLTIIGSGFTGTTRVSFGGTLTPSFVPMSDNVISAQVPARAAGTVDVTVTTPGGTSPTTVDDRFTYVVPPAPVVSSIAPTSSSTLGDETIAVLGSGFSGATRVAVSGTPIGFEVISDAALYFYTRLHDPGTVDVTVTTPGGTSAVTPADQLTYVAPPPPVVNGLGPASGSLGGAENVTIIGTNLAGPTTISFGDTPVSDGFVIGPNYYIVHAPPHAAGTVDVTVTTRSGTSAVSPADRFTYVVPPAPAVNGLSPTSGPTSGGSDVTIVGTNFAGATIVSFGGIRASFTILSNSAVRARTSAFSVNTVYPVATATVYRNADGTGPETTSYAYTWFPNTLRMQSMTTTQPVISAAQNGPGVADTQTTFYDGYGREIWHRNGDGFLRYTEYDTATGAILKAIRDVKIDAAHSGDYRDPPPGWTTPPGGGLHLVMLREVDALGRDSKLTDPNGNISYLVYNDANHEVRTYAGWNASANRPTGPTVVRRADRGHDPSYSEALTMSAVPHVTAGRPDGGEAISNVQTLSRTFVSPGGQVIESDAYFSLSGLGYTTDPFIGTAGTNYYRTLYGYDQRGNQDRAVSPTGTILRTVYDGLERAVSTWLGTNDTPPSGTWSPDNNIPPANMTKVSENVYDGGGVGDSNLTQMTQYPGIFAAPRVTQYFYDWRDRLVASKQGVQDTETDGTHRPIFYQEYDNLSEVVSQERYDGDGISLTVTGGVPARPDSSLLRAKSTGEYDDQGRVFRTHTYLVDQGTGTVSANSLTSATWYDHRGQVVKTAQPGGLVSKVVYDGAGRAYKAYTTDGQGDSTWGDAFSVAGNNVLSQTQTTFDNNSNAIFVVTKDRFHDETATGELASPAAGPKARVSYGAQYYDVIDRLTDTVAVGTNGGLPYTRPASVPAASNTVLVTHRAYDEAGRLLSTTDPRGLVTRHTYDLLGRSTRMIEAYTGDGTPTNTSNRTTAVTYDGSNHVLTHTAVLPAGVTQTTQYVYGVTGVINSNDLLASVIYPDNGQPRSESYAYDALGEVVGKTDRNGSTHAHSFDVLGRPISDSVTTLAAGLDGRVQRIDAAYDTGGRPFRFTSYAEPAGTTVVNQVQRAYNGLSQLSAEYQSHAGAVDTSSTPSVQYAYSEMSGGANHSRLLSMTYPNGRVIRDAYNNGLDDRISRLSFLADDDGTGGLGRHLEEYAYLGVGIVVRRAHPEPGVDLTSIKQAAEPNGDAGDPYTGLDRFGRLVDQRWLHTSDGSASDRFQYGYDRDSNRLYRDNLVNPAFSELYHANGPNNGYDNFNQLTAFARGALNPAKDTIASPSRSQSWTLDALGNWNRLTSDGADQNRGHNLQNQITAIDAGLTTPAYDNNGNTLTDERGNAYVYDAWNRPVQVSAAAGNRLAAYSYDALDRRVTSGDPSGAVTDLYYSAAWQVVEERAGGAMQAQYVWSPVYVDALVERDSADGRRLYVQQDANWNTTALVDTAGAVQERYVYDPYGPPTVLAPDWSARTSSLFGWLYLYQGGRLDTATGLYQFRNRDYSPSLGRWLQQDPAGYSGGSSNLYGAVGEAPANSVDPTGLSWWSDFKQAAINVYNGDLNPDFQRGLDIIKGSPPVQYVRGSMDNVRQQIYDGNPGSGVQREVRGAAQGIMRSLIGAGEGLLHPIDSAYTLGENFGHGLQMLWGDPGTTLENVSTNVVTMFSNDPGQTIASLLTNLALIYLTSKGASRAGKAGASECPTAIKNAVKRLVNETDAAVPIERTPKGLHEIEGGTQPNRIYSARELIRRAEEPGPFHNFPESFNQQIFNGNRQVVSPNYILYTERGFVNGRAGTYEIGVRPSATGNTEVIVHRFFRPD